MTHNNNNLDINNNYQPYPNHIQSPSINHLDLGEHPHLTDSYGQQKFTTVAPNNFHKY